MPNLHSNCLLCNSNSLVELPRYSQAGLVKCKSCQFVFAKGIPSHTELVEHYEKYPRNDEISKITLTRFQELCDQFAPYHKTGNWLDVGAGDGHLLEVAAQNNWNVFGTEFTDTAIEICQRKGIRMHQGVLNPANYEPGSFDVITFIEVLEHINNPHEEMEKFSQLLRQGGILYITTPNFNSVTRHLLKSNWNVVEYPEHLSYYNPDTLHNLLTQHGFRKLELQTTGITPAAYHQAKTKDSGTVVSAAESNEKYRSLLESSVIGRLLKMSVNKGLDILRIGDSLKAFYQKQ